jgi:hypothetical protein
VNTVGMPSTSCTPATNSREMPVRRPLTRRTASGPRWRPHRDRMATRIKGLTSRMSAAGGGLEVTTGVLEGGCASLKDMARTLLRSLIELAEHRGEIDLRLPLGIFRRPRINRTCSAFWAPRTSSDWHLQVGQTLGLWTFTHPELA